MGLSLKDVYDMRNGIIDFSNKLFSDNSSLVFKNSNGINKMLETISFKTNALETADNKKTKSDSKKEKVKKDPIAEKNRKEYIKDFKNTMLENQKDAAKHMIALDVYALLVEKQKDLLALNKGKENDPVIVEFNKNVDIFKAQMLKNGIYSFEIDAKLKNDPNLQARTISGLARNFNDVNEELTQKNNVTARNKNVDTFKQEFFKFMDTENLERFDAKEINQNTSKFYGLVKNAGFNFARRLDTDYYEMSNNIEKCPSGYKYNEAGLMVEKESKGFFEKISNFFGRLFNSGKAKEYNAQLQQSREALHDEEALKDLEEMNKYNQEKTLINLDKEFEKETEISKDYQKDLIIEKTLFRESLSSQEEKIGPNLDQLD